MLSSREEAHDSAESDTESAPMDNDDTSCDGEDKQHIHSIDCANRDEDHEANVYSLEELFGFKSLQKFCSDIEKLR